MGNSREQQSCPENMSVETQLQMALDRILKSIIVYSRELIVRWRSEWEWERERESERARERERKRREVKSFKICLEILSRPGQLFSIESKESRYHE